MKCNHCGKEIKELVNYCPNCGHNILALSNTKPIDEIGKIESTICDCGNEKRNIYRNFQFSGETVCVFCFPAGVCPHCRRTLRSKKAQQCWGCGSSWRIEPPKKFDSPAANQSIYITHSPQKKHDAIKCPSCKSERITSHKKGFSGTKAVGGALLAGGVGVLAGTIGSNKIMLTCLSCGKQFKVGEDYSGIRRKQKQEAEAMKSPFFWILFAVFVGAIIFILRGCLAFLDG